jgi:hypothetical protein
MNWHKLLLRLSLLLALGLTAGGYVLYRQWASPEAVRAAVLKELADQFPGASVQLGDAELRLLGGVELTDVKLTRTGDTTPFAELPQVLLRHDKEELGKGRLVIRRIELHGPRLTVIRQRDGSWNLAGVARGSSSGRPPPAIEVHRAAITVIDEVSAGSRVELSEVDAVATPDENGNYRVHAEGREPQLGSLTAEGRLQPRTGELQLAARAPEVPITSPLLARLAPYLTPCGDSALELRGVASLEVELTHQRESAKPWTHQVKLNLRDGSIRHERFPLPLERVAAKLEWNGQRLVLHQLTGHSHGATVSVHGGMQGLTAADDFHLHLKAEKLRITPDLFAKLPPQLARLGSDYSPEGTLSLKSEVRQTAGQLVSSFTAMVEGAAIRYREFPVQVTGLTGTLAYREDAETPELTVSLVGLAKRRPVRISGKVYGAGLRPSSEARPGFHLDITGSNLPIEEEFLAALPAVPQSVARQFEPSGLFDARAELRRKSGTPQVPRMPTENRYVIQFHNASMRYEKFPYRVEEVHGTLELIPGRWSFTGFRGRHKEGVFTGHANSLPTPQGDLITVHVKGENAMLDREMEAALISPKMSHAYRLFSPLGRVDFTAKVETLAKQEPQLELQVNARNITMKPTCFPYLLTQVRGSFHYSKDRVTLREFQARHGGAFITLGRDGDGGDVELRPGAGFKATLRQLHADQLTVDRELLDALPKLVGKSFAVLKPDRPVRVVTDLTIDDPGQGGRVRYDWNGHAAFADTTLQIGFPLEHVTGLVAIRGKHDGVTLDAKGHLKFDQLTIGKQVFRDVRTELTLTQNELVFQGLSASLHGGQLYGPIRVDFLDEPTFRVDLRASQVDLEKFARETLGRGGQVKGRANAKLELRGRGNDLSTLRGSGSLNIEEGRLYDLPLVLDLLSTLSGHLPKGSAFQEANAEFTIEGDRLRVGQIRLIGDALTLEGDGEMKVDGSMVKLEMYGLLWGRTLPLLPAIIDQIPSWLSKRLMKIVVEGDLTKVKAKVEPVPVLVEPVKALLKSAAGRQGTERKEMRRP